MMTQKSSPAALMSPFVRKFYDEAFALLIEWRNVVAFRTGESQAEMSQTDKLLFSARSLELTTGLAHLMAWVLSRRAVCAGEIAADEVFDLRFAQARDNPLLSVNIADESREAAAMPSAYHDILRRSILLCERARRLEDTERARLAPASTQG